MNKILTLCIAGFFLIIQSCNQKNNSKKIELHEKEDFDMYDGPGQAAKFEFERTKDPVLGYVPTDRLLVAIDASVSSKKLSGGTVLAGTWVERGPNKDVSGPYGNSRDPANLASTSGRIRAAMVDASDATGKTVFIGGVNGGLWKTNDITAANPNWIMANDNLSNLAVTAITQDPTNSNIMYFCTGEAFYNGDAVAGVGVFKSTDGGISWALLPSTTNYFYSTNIICDYQGNIYLATRGNGLLRSTKASGGNAWVDITPTGMSNRICDLDISSTTAAGRLHVVGGIFSSQSYRYTDNPSTVASSGFTAPAVAFPSFNNRAEIAVKGNTLFAMPVNGSDQIPTIYKSTDGGANWIATAGQPPTNWANGQGWYSITVEINPANASQCIIGGLDTYKTIDGGTTWTKLSQWYGYPEQYLHADHHKIIWYGGGNKVLFANDGGIFYSSDGGTTIIDKNVGLRIKQFYSCAMHPTSVNYFLAGAQDNGCHSFSDPGLSFTTEVLGGDGCFVHIDQNEPQYQICSYIYNNYRISYDGGANWAYYNFNSNTGQFINPTDYDDNANVLYCSNTAGNYFRWTDPQAGGVGTTDAVAISALAGKNVSALTVSPYTSSRLYMGTYGNNAKLCYVDNAKAVATGAAGVDITANLSTSGSISCVAIGTNENNLMATFSNYGVQQVWVSTNGGTSWTNIDGNLPDMPVRWCMFAPGNNTKAILATEAGVWVTSLVNGASTVWTASPTFPAVRTDMLQYRPLDGMVAAATHGRGLWTQTAASILPLDNFKLNGVWTGSDVKLNWVYDDQIIGSQFEVEASTNGVQFAKVGNVSGSINTKYDFNYSPLGAQSFYYRIKVRDISGGLKYSNIIRLYKNSNGKDGISITNFYPNPVVNNLSVSFNVPTKGNATYAIYNTAGQMLWNKIENLEYVGGYSLNENVAFLKAGTYIFTINVNDKKTKQMFIKK